MWQRSLLTFSGKHDPLRLVEKHIAQLYSKAGIKRTHKFSMLFAKQTIEGQISNIGQSNVEFNHVHRNVSKSVIPCIVKNLKMTVLKLSYSMRDQVNPISCNIHNEKVQKPK